MSGPLSHRNQLVPLSATADANLLWLANSCRQGAPEHRSDRKPTLQGRLAGRDGPDADMLWQQQVTGGEDRIENAQCIDSALRFALLKVLFCLRHPVCNVGKTENFSLVTLSEGI